jgi:uncharacterized membrane protein YeaQ/YmgE (transglycosylase-associated protein family)
MGLDLLLGVLITGAVAGSLAALIVKGFGFGLLRKTGFVGAVIGGCPLPRVGLSMGGGRPDAIISATIGAVILLLLIRLVKRAQESGPGFPPARTSYATTLNAGP